MMRMGGFCFSIVRTCTGVVCVRRTWRDAVGLRRDIERVVHLPRRMIGRDVELGEIVIVEFDVRAFGDGKAQIGEDRGDFVQHLADGMDGAARLGTRRQRHIDAFPGELGAQRLIGQRRFARGDGLAHPVAQAVEQRALNLALLRRSCAPSVFSNSLTQPFLPSARHAHSFKRRFIARGFKGG